LIYYKKDKEKECHNKQLKQLQVQYFKV